MSVGYIITLWSYANKKSLIKRKLKVSLWIGLKNFYDSWIPCALNIEF